MLRNYFLIAWRNMRQNKVFSAINVLGLAMGFTCCLLITLYIHQELHYDAHFKGAKNIYQLGTVFIGDDGERKGANTPAPMAAAMQQEYPEIERTARLLRLFQDDKTLLQYNGGGTPESFYESGGYIADSTFFQVLSYPFLEGNPATALQAPLSIVLSDEIARKIFGKTSALNKTIHVSSSTNGDYDFTVTGVLESGKFPSHIDARFFLSFGGGQMQQYMRNSTDMANNNMYYTYLLLRPDADAKALERKFPAFIEKYARADLKAVGRDRKQFLIPLQDIHLRSDVDQNVTPPGSPIYLYILASIALLTLLIACINFMNLSTSRSAKRAAEVGVRKVLGANRGSLVGQFLGESLLLALFAFIIALLLTWALLPLFQQVSGKQLMLSLKQHGGLLAAFLLLALLTGVVAGSYPAFYLSSFQPVRVLKGRFSNSLAAVSLRKGLVIFQFVISVVLIVASVIIGRQMKYLRSTDLGFEKEQQVVLPLRSNAAKEALSALRTELERAPGIQSVGASVYYPGITNFMDWGLYRQGTNMNSARRTYINPVNETYLQTLGIKPVAGRLFSAEFPGDTASNMIVNEKAVAEYGFRSPADAVGKWVAFDWQGEQQRFTIVGVVKDFHFKDLHVAIEPYAFLRGQNDFNYLIARAAPGKIEGVLNHIQDAWARLNPNEPFEYSFLDQDFQKNYRAEEQLSALIRYFTFIAILISCLGLFGLASFSAEQRTKEIGIRKVLGASIANLVGLLSRDFLKLVAIAAFIAFPIAWYAMHQWLDNFAYRISMPWITYLLAGIIAMLIAFLTIAGHAVKAALTNPVKNLRTE